MPSRLRKINIKNELKKKYLINKSYLNDDSLIKNIYLEEDIEDLLKEIEILKKNGYKKINLEIGCGVGEYIRKLAEVYKDEFFIGIDYDIQVIFRAIKNIKETEFLNIKFLALEASLLLNEEKLFNKFDRIIIPFPDPWPKKRHKKRRFLKIENIKKLQNLLKESGMLIIITDNEDYANSINNDFIFLDENNLMQLRKIFQNSYYTNKRETFEKIFPFEETRYYKKAISNGSKIFYFVLKKSFLK